MKRLVTLIMAAFALQACTSAYSDSPGTVSTASTTLDAIQSQSHDWDEFALDRASLANDPETAFRKSPAASSYPVRVRLADVLDEEQRRIGQAAISQVPGVIVHPNATYELNAHPEFPEHLVFHKIKGASAEDREGMGTSYRREGVMSLADIYDYYDDDHRRKYAWASNVPVPVELGRADRPDFAEDLRKALIPIAQRAGLEAMARYTNPHWLTLCVSHERPWGNACPQEPGTNLNQVSNDRPAYLSVVNYFGYRRFITIVSVAPSGKHSVLHQQWSEAGYDPVTYVPAEEIVAIAEPEDDQVEADPNSNAPSQTENEEVHREILQKKKLVRRRVTRDADSMNGTNDAPPVEIYEPPPPRFFASTQEPEKFFEEPGQHKVYVIATDDPIDPAIWQLEFGDEMPAEMCTGFARALCLAMTGADPEELGQRAIDVKAYTVNSMGYIKKTDRVVIGVRATRAQALWQAQLLVYRPGGPFYRSTSSPRFNYEKMHKCGGSYVGGGFVVTAAHCIRDDISEMRVRLGSNDMLKGGYTFRVH